MDMFKFDFELDAEDVCNLFGCIQSEISNLNDLIMDEMAGENRTAYIDAYRGQIEYTKQLMGKLHHTKIEQQDNSNV